MSDILNKVCEAVERSELTTLREALNALVAAGSTEDNDVREALAVVRQKLREEVLKGSGFRRIVSFCDAVLGASSLVASVVYKPDVAVLAAETAHYCAEYLSTAEDSAELRSSIMRYGDVALTSYARGSNCSVDSSVALLRCATAVLRAAGTRPGDERLAMVAARVGSSVRGVVTASLLSKDLDSEADVTRKDAESASVAFLSAHVLWLQHKGLFLESAQVAYAQALALTESEEAEQTPSATAAFVTAVRNTLLASPPSPSRTQLAAALCADNRHAAVPQPLLQALRDVAAGRLLRPACVDALRGSPDWQSALSQEALTLAVARHNLPIAARAYECVSFARLARVLALPPPSADSPDATSAADRVISLCIESAELTAPLIDEEHSVVRFHAGHRGADDEVNEWSHRTRAICAAVSLAADSILQLHPELETHLTC